MGWAIAVRHPFQAVPARIAVALFVISFGATVVFALKTYERRLRVGGVAPLGIVSLELAGTSERASAIIEAWGPELTERARTVQRWDYLFIPAYAVLMALAASGVGVIWGERWIFSELSGIFAWGAIAAGLLDLVENGALAVVLGGNTAQPWPRVSQLAAGAKFALLLAVLGLVIGALLYAAWAAAFGTNSPQE